LASSVIAVPCLLVIDDDITILHTFRRFFGEPAIRLLTASTGAEGLKLAEQHRPDAVILDLCLPDMTGMEIFRSLQAIDPKLPVIVVTGHGTMETAIDAMKADAIDYLIKPVGLDQIREVVQAALRVRWTANHLAPRPEPDLIPPSDIIVGRCPAMQEVFKAIGRVAAQNVTVLILGESGIGKELIARAIYQHSARADRPFLAINCAAIPENLLESELFGHEKGAFTGADRRRIGKFEQCNGGTIFLDEVGDMPPATQAKILRLLQEQRFERVGGSETIQTDVRVIAATNKDLQALVEQERFRDDLYYRLSVFGIALPPLRERGSDLALLVDYFLKKFSRELGKEITQATPEAVDALLKYPWPGNIRELQSVLKQALLRAHGHYLLAEFLPPLSLEKQSAGQKAGSIDPGLAVFIEDRLQAGATGLYWEVHCRVDRLLLGRIMNYTGGNKLQTARILGITRAKLRSELRTLGLVPAETEETGADGEEVPQVEMDEQNNGSLP
jgi:DNA-binding NtrC family response regulator